MLLRVSEVPVAEPLDSYRHAFLGRYGPDREVALLELLDPERGLGPPTGGAQRPQSPAESAAVAARHATLRRIAVQALRDRRIVAELDEATDAALRTAVPSASTAPISADLSIFVLAHNVADVDAGNFRLMIGPNLGAQSAGRNLGRFADVLDGPATVALAAVAAAEIEHDPAALHAEVVYLPLSSRSANVAIRPCVYGHEVLVTGVPGGRPDGPIPVSELLVGVRDGRLYVRWPGMPGALHVHAGHMLTPHAAPVACRFLEDVARGSRVGLSTFQWGPLTDLPFLPRIELERVVLSPAQWRIDALQRAEALPPDDDRFEEMLARWRAEWMVPRRVYLTTGDNRLLLDLEAPAQVAELREDLRRVRRNGSVLLQEPLPGPEHAWLEGPAGRHLVELVVPLVQRSAPAASFQPLDDPPVSVPAAARADRIRPPGSDWLYAKLYGPRNGQDELLAGTIRRFCEIALGSGLAERWFFVRYADPQPHLRLRFAGEPDQLVAGFFRESAPGRTSSSPPGTPRAFRSTPMSARSSATEVLRRWPAPRRSSPSTAARPAT